MIAMSIVIIGGSWTDTSLVLGKRERGREGARERGEVEMMEGRRMVIFTNTVNVTILFCH